MAEEGIKEKIKEVTRSFLIVLSIILVILSLLICYFHGLETAIKWVFAFGGIILIGITFYYFCIDNHRSVTFHITWITIIFGIYPIIVKPDFFTGKEIIDLTPANAAFFYEQIIIVLTSIFMGFVLGVSLLWASFRPQPINFNGTNTYTGKTVDYLTKQTLFLLGLLGYIIVVIYFVIIRELTILIVSGI